MESSGSYAIAEDEIEEVPGGNAQTPNSLVAVTAAALLAQSVIPVAAGTTDTTVSDLSVVERLCDIWESTSIPARRHATTESRII